MPPKSHFCAGRIEHVHAEGGLCLPSRTDVNRTRCNIRRAISRYAWYHKPANYESLTKEPCNVGAPCCLGNFVSPHPKTIRPLPKIMPKLLRSLRRRDITPNATCSDPAVPGQQPRETSPC